MRFWINFERERGFGVVSGESICSVRCSRREASPTDIHDFDESIHQTLYSLADPRDAAISFAAGRVALMIAGILRCGTGNIWSIREISVIHP